MVIHVPRWVTGLLHGMLPSTIITLGGIVHVLWLMHVASHGRLDWYYWLDEVLWWCESFNGGLRDVRWHHRRWLFVNSVVLYSFRTLLLLLWQRIFLQVFIIILSVELGVAGGLQDVFFIAWSHTFPFCCTFAITCGGLFWYFLFFWPSILKPNFNLKLLEI